MRFSYSKRRRSSYTQQALHRSRLGIESLESRRMLAAVELNSLLAANGGDGTAGFVAHGPTTGTGFALSLSGDLNGDGYADLLISDPDFDPLDNPGKPSWKYQRTEGAVFVVFGNEQGIPAEVDLTSLDGTNGFAIYGNPEDPPGTYVGTGWTLAGGADLNSDGVDDAVISTKNSTRAYVLYGNRQWGAVGTPAVIELQSLTPSHGGNGSPGFVFNGPMADFARSVTMDGDVNGDGVHDVVIGAESLNDSAGGAIVVFGRDADQPFPSEFSWDALDGTNGVVINGIASGDFADFSVTTAGDLNGDGTNDIVIGARRASPDLQRPEAGRVFVVYGGASLPSTIELSDLLIGNGEAGFVLNGIRGNIDSVVVGDRAGVSVHSGGDFNGDGISDLAIGASRARNEAGSVEVGEGYVVFGRSAADLPFPARFELSALDGTSGVTVRGLDEGDSLAKFVAIVNFNGDAYADLVLTAPGGDPHGRTDAGEVFVVFGSADVQPGGLIDLTEIIAGNGSAGLVIRGSDAGSQIGGRTSVATVGGPRLGVGDFNGDGVDDVALGSERSSTQAYVLFGGGNIVPPPAHPSFSIDDVAVPEGDNGTVAATFTVTRIGDTSSIVSVNYATTDGSATANSDYIPIKATTLTFASGVTTQQIEVTILSDTLDEGDETFMVNLLASSEGTTIADGIGVATIVDDDAVIDANILYVWDIQDTFESRKRGRATDYRLVIDVRRDSDADGVAEVTDVGAAGVAVTVKLTDTSGQVLTFTGVTDSQGIFRSDWIKSLNPDTYRAEVVDLALAGFTWDPLDVLDATVNDDDDDLDGDPDQLLFI